MSESSQRDERETAGTARDDADASADPRTVQTRTLTGSPPALGDRLAGPDLEAAGTLVGRYVILEHIASGGMGAVYKAYDPQLDRQIALKLVALAHPDPVILADQRERLLREAQALAQLSHPNVVAVHDVGTVRDQVFVAMELVAGESVRHWLRAGQRSRAEVLDVFLAAGRGLAAAHRSGIVHRDVKPSNIMFGHDGRVRVVDFGLARGAGDESVARSLESSGDTSVSGKRLDSNNKLDTPLTRAGVVMGTPHYMAPEQQLGLALDPRADQYSFCVSLYEALCGQRPVAEPGPRRTVATEATLAAIPRRLRSALRVGLAPRPEDRYPSMDALLVALARDPWWRRAPLLGAAALVASTAVLAVALGGRADPLCDAGRARMDETWNGERKAAMSAALQTSSHPFPRESTEAIARQLDSFASSWNDVYLDACAATHVRREQSSRLLDQRMRCLERRRRQVADLLAMLSDAPTPKLIDRGARAVVQIGDLAGCGADAALAAVPPPTDPARRRAVERAQRAIDRAELLYRTGRYEEAAEAAERGLALARSSEHTPIEAVALLRLGKVQIHRDQLDAAESSLRQGLTRAAQARDLEAVAAGWVELAGLFALSRSQYDAASQLVHAAEVALALAGEPARLRAQFERDLGAIALRQGDYHTAEAHFQRYAELVAAGHPPGHAAHAAPLNNLGAVALELGRHNAARSYLARAIAVTEAAYGPYHPSLAYMLVNLGHLLREQGHFEASLAPLGRALAIDEAALGPNHQDLANTRNALGSSLVQVGRIDEAIAQFTSARDAIAAGLGAGHHDISWSLANLSEAYLERGELEQAESHLRKALELRARALGPDHPDVADLRGDLARVYAARGDLRAARRAYGAAIADLEAGLGADSPRLGRQLGELGRLELGAGAVAVALPVLERALAILDGHATAPQSTAQLRFALARTLWTTDTERERARALARDALAASEPAGDRAAEIEKWLAARTPRPAGGRAGP